MRVILLFGIAGLKVLLCKGAALGIFLLVFYIKGRQLKFNSEKWDAFFLDLSEKKVKNFAIGIYFAAAAVSSIISYVVLNLLNYRYSFAIALIIFISGVIITGCKWRIKGKEYLLKRFREIPQTILDKRQGNNEG